MSDITARLAKLRGNAEELAGSLERESSRKDIEDWGKVCSAAATVIRELLAALGAYESERAERPPCATCGQTDIGQYGEYPCSACGLPRTWGTKVSVMDDARDAARYRWLRKESLSRFDERGVVLLTPMCFGGDLEIDAEVDRAIAAAAHHPVQP